MKTIIPLLAATTMAGFMAVAQPAPQVVVAPTNRTPRMVYVAVEGAVGDSHSDPGPQGSFDRNIHRNWLVDWGWACPCLQGTATHWLVVWGYSPNAYSFTNDAGTNTSYLLFPRTGPTPVYDFSYDGHELGKSSDMPNLTFRSYVTSFDPPWVTIATSSDGIHWTNPYLMFISTNHFFTKTLLP